MRAQPPLHTVLPPTETSHSTKVDMEQDMNDKRGRRREWTYFIFAVVARQEERMPSAATTRA